MWLRVERKSNSVFLIHFLNLENGKRFLHFSRNDKAMVMRTMTAIACACIASGVIAAAPISPGEEVTQLFEGAAQHSVRLQYLLFLPADYNRETRRRWPLILYLHGGSLRGNNIERVRTLGLPHRLQHDRQFPFVVVAPLCAEGEIWTDTDALVQLVNEVVRNYRVDNKRVYVTGHSMGGRGALYVAYKCPERFAAVVAMSPLSPIAAWARQLRNVPLWIIHGGKDTAAPIKDSKELVHAIEAAGGHPRFTRLADRDHFILDVYVKNGVFDWMVEHSR
jgi:predicted peptidase